MSFYEKFNKNKNSYNPLEIIQYLESEGNNTENIVVSKITPTLISAFPPMYNLFVDYTQKNNFITETKVYNLVDSNLYNKICETIISKKLYYKMEGVLEPEDPYWGFDPLFTAARFCFHIIIAYYIYTILKTTAGQFMDQFVDKTKTNQKRNISHQPTLTFDQIAGADEEKEEMQELVDFLKNPKKYADMGARIPKGVLLSGPPGTGKTLLAKALAGEAKVPFFAVSGSEFVEMFVGVGAARIRNLFQTAQKNAPCIIFIDEIESVARKRGMTYGNSEQEQTLNQLLIELDGYNQNIGVIVIAATNQPNFLDPALLRPGRFDRRFTINLPSVKDREAILKLHSMNKRLADDVILEDLAKQTPGCSGAQLEGILNEAALLAARNKMFVIDKKTISEALDRILLGPAKKSRKYSQKDKKMVAFHEAGHAVACLKLPDAKKVHKITIIPRGHSGGYNLMLDEEETFFLSKKKLLVEIAVCLSGRAAEEIFLDDISNGASEDFRMATEIARMMVTKFGMSVVGLTQFSQDSQHFQKNFSDPKALEIDQAIQNIISECYKLAKKTISENKELLFKIVEYLLEIETLTQKDINEIYNTGKIQWFDKEKEKSSEINENIIENCDNSLEKEQNRIDEKNNNNEYEIEDYNDLE
ncbi:ATP-dependent zinc metalloprotease FtsH [Texas Phoenix palm phytoplasma]|uniref:ATP-dependent zinc metalloprotease FtsH n=2 Tax=Texas Phoenix palm phytoplasma TaxID=176709 RepID=A0ABS5BI03_9MOLU|nr:ATP-dependent zinc metalloprotease FtsH [Texas Phoenix palm phytoplasma]